MRVLVLCLVILVCLGCGNSEAQKEPLTCPTVDPALRSTMRAYYRSGTPLPPQIQATVTAQLTLGLPCIQATTDLYKRTPTSHTQP